MELDRRPEPRAGRGQCWADPEGLPLCRARCLTTLPMIGGGNAGGAPGAREGKRVT